MKKAQFYLKKAENKVQCLLCPHNCLIGEEKTGICRVRLNHQGELTLPFYGELSAIAVDPVEKKPLYHFFPGRPILSLGFWGCTFRCPFCQNYQISQTARSAGRSVMPEEVVKTALERGSFGIAYTYSEPLVHCEYLLDTTALAREKGLKNVLVSNGYINPQPAARLLPWIDAANIDLKAFNADFYRKEIGGKLSDVKRFLELAAPLIHLEVTTLIIPGKNDDEAEIDELAAFLAGLNPDIPYHLSCYYPTYQYTIPATPPQLVEKLAAVASRHLHYVYQGNIGLKESNTYCPVCRKLLIKRAGYQTTIAGLARENEPETGVSRAVCAGCRTPVPIEGVW